MPYIYIRNEDSVVAGVHDAQLNPVPTGYSEVVGEWPHGIKWCITKVISNGDGTYTITDVPHPDDNDGLI
jgi:hypothetical protein